MGRKTRRSFTKEYKAEVVDLIRLLRTVMNPRDEVSFAAALRSPFCGLSEDALLALVHVVDRTGEERSARRDQPEQATAAGIGGHPPSDSFTEETRPHSHLCSGLGQAVDLVTASEELRRLNLNTRELREEYLRRNKLLREEDKAVLAGKDTGPRADIVCLNAAPLLYIMGKAKDLGEGFEMAQQGIAEGKALDKLRDWVTWQNEKPEDGLPTLEKMISQI